MNTKKEISQKFQSQLKPIRQMLELSTQELADDIGVTRQTINNLENGKSPLSETQVIALLAVIDRRLHNDSPEFRQIRNMLDFNIHPDENHPFETELLLDSWFHLSGLHYKEYTMDGSNSEDFMKTIHIFDTSQLIKDSSIIPILCQKKEEIYIPLSTIHELNKELDNQILNDSIITQIIQAKKILKTHRDALHFWKSQRFRDSSILQLIVQKINDPFIKYINIYTSDTVLAKDCLEISKRRSCIVNILEYQEGKKIPFDEKLPSYPKKLTHLKAMIWKNGQALSNFNQDDSFSEENSSIPTLSGNALVTKFWAWYPHTDEIYRIYQKIHLHQGEIVTINLRLQNHQCQVKASLMAYSESDHSENHSESILLQDTTWKPLTLFIKKDCDEINILLQFKKDLNESPEQTHLICYMDDFKITNSTPNEK